MLPNYSTVVKILLLIILYFITLTVNFAQQSLDDLFYQENVTEIFKNSNNIQNSTSVNNILTADSLLILPLGNSITFDKRSNDTRLDEDKPGYRLPLYDSLSQIGLNFDFIGSEKSGWNFLPIGYEDNAGFPGIKDNELASLLETGVRNQPPDFNNDTLTLGPYLETYLPDVILLHIGTNGNQYTDGTSAADIENILNEVDRVENLYNKDIYVVVAKIIDRVPNETYVTEFNYNVDSMVTDRVNNPANPSYPDKLFVVDMEDSAKIIYAIDSMGTVGNGIIGDMNDHLHPNDKGFVKMANVWFNAINTLFPNPITVVNQPTDVETFSGLTATFSVNVISTDSVTFQWKKNGEIIPGANDSVFTTLPLSITDNLSQYMCEIYSNYYTVKSDTATLFISDSTSRITTNLVAEYNFEEGSGNIVTNKIIENSNLDLTIRDVSAVNWVPYGLEVKNNTGIFTNLPAKELYNKVIETNEITLEAWIIPDNDTLVGPARIITFSENTGARNFTLGQESDSFEVRLRTTETTNNGKPAVFSTKNSVTDSLLHVVYTRNNVGEVKLFINGELNSTDTVNGDFSNWDSTYFFGLANETTEDRLWLGKFYLAGVYNRALSPFEVLHNYNIKFNGYNELLAHPTNLAASVVNDTSVVLTWEDNETMEQGYIIERRSTLADSTFYILDSVAANTVEYIDNYPKYYSSYVYRVKAYNNFTESQYSALILVDGIVTSIQDNYTISSFQLYQNYPNPFNPSTKISFSLPKKSEIQLKIFNTLGQVVKIIYNNVIKSPGKYSEIFDAHSFASGVYFVQIVATPLDGSQKFIKINKALLIK